MSTTWDYILIGADDGAPLATPQGATDRDREYSAMLYFMQWGCFPGGPEESFCVFSPDGTPARPPTATVPLDHPVHTSSTGRLLKGEKREEKLELERHEEQYEAAKKAAAKKRAPGPSHRQQAKGKQPET